MRFRALATLIAGAGLALAAQLAAPVGRPLYDGVVVNEPYRYLEPASGQPGDPTTFASAPGLTNGASRAFAASTTENPPQAQLIALPGAFVPPPGATTMQVSIEPIVPGAGPTTGSIAGNVYRFAVTDDAGVDFSLAAGAQPTLTLRAPENVVDALIGHRTAAGWVVLTTDHGGGQGLFAVIPTELGDYAVLVGATAPSDFTSILAIGVSIGLPLLAVIVYVIRRDRRTRRATVEAESARSKARVPSKRRTKRR